MATKSEEKRIAVQKEDKPKQSSKIWKGQEQFEHHLFKLEPTDCIKNKSFTPYSPNTYTRQHSHFFHSVDRKGKPQTTCGPSAGHFHEVEVVWDGDELVSVKCGPPIRLKYRMQRNKEMRRVREAVVYKGRDESGADDIIDNHVHDVTYVRSEILKLQPQHDHTAGADYISKKYASASAAEALRHAQAITKS